MACADCAHDIGVTMGTPQDHPHRSRMQTQTGYRFGSAAGLALNLCGRYLKSEDFLKKTGGCIAVQNERVIASHDAIPRVRSVLS